MATDIVIPVRNNLSLTQSMVSQLQDQEGWRHCLVFNNGSTDDTREYLDALTYDDDRFYPHLTPDKTIYEMWSLGFEYSKINQADYVAIFNNDLILAPNTIESFNSHMDQNLYTSIVYPDYNVSVESESVWRGGYRYTKGTYRDGGVSGFCFQLRTSAITWNPLVDPGFKLWYGDDDLAHSVQKAGGKQARLIGLPLDHIGQATCNQYPEMFAGIPADKEYFEEKWGV